MRIAVVTDLVYPAAGGVEILLERLMPLLVARGHQVMIVSGLPEASAPRHEVAGTVASFRFYLGLPQATNPKTWILYLLNGSKSRRELRTCLAEFKPDVINLHFPGAAARYVYEIKRSMRIPLVVSLHGNDVQLLPVISTLMRLFLAKVLQSADFITACSDKILQDAQRLVTFSAPAKAIRNGVDLNEFEAVAAKTGQNYVLAAGRLVPKKGFDLLIEAFSQISPDFPDLRLIIAGDGESRRALESQRDSLGLTGRIDFVGRIARTELISLFKACLFFVLPSRREPLGLVNLEAMAAGKAVVAFAVDGVPEIIDEEVGLLVEPGNVRALSSAMRDLLGDQAKAGTLGNNGRRRAVERHSMDKTAEEYLAVYEQAIEQARSSATGA